MRALEELVSKGTVTELKVGPRRPFLASLRKVWPKLPIPMKVVSDSDLISVTHSDAEPVTVGAKRRWRSYRDRSDRDRSTGI